MRWDEKHGELTLGSLGSPAWKCTTTTSSACSGLATREGSSLGETGWTVLTTSDFKILSSEKRFSLMPLGDSDAPAASTRVGAVERAEMCLLAREVGGGADMAGDWGSSGSKRS